MHSLVNAFGYQKRSVSRTAFIATVIAFSEVRTSQIRIWRFAKECWHLNIPPRVHEKYSKVVGISYIPSTFIIQPAFRLDARDANGD